MKNLEVSWNNIIFQFNSPNIDDWDISENFDYKNKIFVFTKWVHELIKTDFLKTIVSPFNYELTSENFKHKLIAEIIDIIYKEAKVKKLDYLQKLSINSVDCWIIDNWEDICLLLPSEY